MGFGSHNVSSTRLVHCVAWTMVIFEVIFRPRSVRTRARSELSECLMLIVHTASRRFRVDPVPLILWRHYCELSTIIIDGGRFAILCMALVARPRPNLDDQAVVFVGRWAPPEHHPEYTRSFEILTRLGDPRRKSEPEHMSSNQCITWHGMPPSGHSVPSRLRLLRGDLRRLLPPPTPFQPVTRNP